MRLPLLLNKKSYLRFAVVLPALGLLALTGCASIDGTTQDQNLTNNQVATYMEESQPTIQPTEPEPSYLWFY